MKEYYDARAPEYDERYLDEGPVVDSAARPDHDGRVLHASDWFVMVAAGDETDLSR